MLSLKEKFVKGSLNSFALFKGYGLRKATFHQRPLFVTLLICTALLAGCGKQPVEEKQVNIVFRLDDYSASSSTEMELKIIDTFRKNEAAITLGVIPYVCSDVHDPSPQHVLPLTPEKGKILKQGYEEGILEIALHGYSHQTIDSLKMTEFNGLNYQRQVEKIVKGKIFLEGIINAQITIFVPPWNSYDLNTLRVLEEHGFLTLSGGKNGTVAADTMLSFLPASCDLSRIREAVDTASISPENQPVIVVLFHEYDFLEVDNERGSITFKEFDDLLSWIKAQDNLRLLSIGQATRMINNLSARRFQLTERNYSLSRFLPSSLVGEDFLYREHPDLIKTCLKVGSFYFLVFSFGTIFTYIVGLLIFSRYAIFMKICTLGSILLSASILIYAFHDLEVSLKGLVVSTGAIGASFGLCLCFLYLNQKKKRLWAWK